MEGRMHVSDGSVMSFRRGSRGIFVAVQQSFEP